MTRIRFILNCGSKLRIIRTSAFAVIVLGALVCPTSAQAQPSGQTEEQPRAEEPKVVNDYVGLMKCAACHFPQYKTWKSTVHGDAFNILPLKYRKETECLTCHAVGYAPGDRGVKVADKGVACEACHGPGGQHARLGLRFVDVGMTEPGLKRLRGLIDRTGAHNCIRCHVSKSHKQHPKFDRDKPKSGAVRQSRVDAPQKKKSFFSFDSHKRDNSRS